MPRLLPLEWIKFIARNYLFQLYEKEPSFVQEWDDVKRPFAPLIEKIAKVSCLIHAKDILRGFPPKDLINWLSNYTKLERYLQDFPGDGSLLQLQENYNELYTQLAPYLSKLNGIAEKWNLRASWAAEELLSRDIQRAEEDVLKVAEVDELLTLSDWQIQRLFKTDESRLSSNDFPINMLSLYLAGGRKGLTEKLNKKLIEFEQKLKAVGVKEPPSALHIHAKWWFDHYVHGEEFPEIANKTIGPNNETGRYPENIRKAVIKFSEITGIEPIEP